MKMQNILSPEKTREIKEKSKQIDHYLAKGRARDKGDYIFVSKFIPPAPPLNLFPTFNSKLEGFNKYRTRSPEPSEELENAFFDWIIAYGIEREDCQVYFSHSINTNILPAIFKSSIFKANDLVLFCAPIYGMLPSKAAEQNLNISAIIGDKNHGYKPQADSIRKALEEFPNARALMIVNPANPTGTVLYKEEINEIADVIREHNIKRETEGKKPIIIIEDQTFQNMQWAPTPLDSLRYSTEHSLPEQDTPPFIPLASHPYLKNHTISLGSFSKVAGPGLGIAYWYGPTELLSQTRPTDGLEGYSQMYAKNFFETLGDNYKFFTGQNFVHQKWDESEDLRKLKTALPYRLRSAVDSYRFQYNEILCRKLTDINYKLKQKFGSTKDYITWTKPEAGFHVAVAFPGIKGMCKTESEESEGADLSKITGVIQNSSDLARMLLDHKQVVAYPGEMFYLPGEDMVLRFSLNMQSVENGITNEGRLHEALDRIEDFCFSLSPVRNISRLGSGQQPGI